jgi:hypothetical protein
VKPFEKKCLAQLLYEPEPKLKNKPYQRGPKIVVVLGLDFYVHVHIVDYEPSYVYNTYINYCMNLIKE